MTRRRVLVVAAIGGALDKAGDLLRLETDQLPAALAQTDSAVIAAQAALRRTQDLLTQGLRSPALLDEVHRSVAVAQPQRAVAAAANPEPADAPAT